MSTAAEDIALRDVYERQYSAQGDDARRYGAWRELCAAGKADHVVDLIRALPSAPRTIAEIGCGDGVLLSQLARRGVGETRHGFDISDRAVAYAADRPEVDEAHAFDGHALPVADAAYDLGILSHVLEHVPDPLPLAVHSFFAETPAARAKALAKATTRHALFSIAPRQAERAFTVHYAALCLPR